MSTERLRIDVGVPDHGTRAGDGFAGGGGRNEPDAQSRERFERALADAPAGSAAATLRQGGPVSPFALFGMQVMPEPAQEHSLVPQLEKLLQHLMVDDRRGQRQVRLHLKEQLLPGVSVVIQEAEGRLQVSFLCGDERWRLRLAASAPAHAMRLARQLRRDVLLQVRRDDDHDPCLVEAAASPSTPASQAWQSE